MLALCAFFLGAPSTSHAGYMNREGGRRAVEIEPHLGTHFHFELPTPGLNLGARVHIPVISSGLVPSFNDALYFGVGLDFYWTRGRGRWGPAFGLPIMAEWRMFFHPKFELSLELGINIYFHTAWFDGGYIFGFNAGFLIGALAVHFNLTDWCSILLRLGSPYTSVGVSFSL